MLEMFRHQIKNMVILIEYFGKLYHVNANGILNWILSE